MRLLIVGGVAGGAAAAARARRLNENAEIVMFERGEYISYASCGLPYYAGDVITKRDALLVQTPQAFKKRFNVDVRTFSEVVKVDKKNKEVTVKDVKTGEQTQESYDYLILAPGAEPLVPPFKGSDGEYVYTVRNVPDIDKVRGALDRGDVSRAVVIGGGFIGVEMAENIIGRGIETHLIERLDQIMMPFDKEMAVILERELVAKGIHLHLSDEVMEIADKGDEAVVKTSKGEAITADMIILSVGVRPETALAKDAGLDVARGIITDDKMMTSDPSIYAIGDAVEVKDPVTNTSKLIPLAGPAAKQARVAVNNIFGIKDSYAGTLGTSIVKVFSLTAAATGANERVLKDAGVKYEKIYTHPADHAGYYPGATQMAIKMLFSPDNGCVLGAQVIGKGGVDKRADILAVCVKQKLGVRELAEFELCYAPPFGSAKDAVNLLGMAAENHMDGLDEFIHWDTLTGDEFLLDVRMPAEIEKGAVNGAVNIPLHELRGRLDEIPKDKLVAVTCQVGVRAHIAVRILAENGFDVKNVSGGYLTYKDWRDAFVSGKLSANEPFSVREKFCSAHDGKPEKS